MGNEVLNNLKKACENMANMGNLQEYKRDNNELDFQLLIQPVVQNYNWILNNGDEEQVNTAKSYIRQIATDNPTLSVIVDFMLKNKNEKLEISKRDFLNKFFSRIDEFRGLSKLSEDICDEYEVVFQRLNDELQKILGMFTESEYAYLIDVLEGEMKRIDGFKNIKNIYNQM